MSYIVDLRNLLYEAILIQRDTQQNASSNYDVIQAYYPETELKNMVRPRVYVIGAQHDDDKLTRCNARMLTLPIQIGLQAKVQPTDVSTMDSLMTLGESLRTAAAKLESDKFNWLRNEGARDQNNTPMNFMELRERHVFQALFTAFYQLAIT